MTRHTSLLTSHDHGHAVEGVVCHWVVRSRHNTQRVLDLRFFFTSLYRFLPPVMISRRRGDGFKEVIVRSISVLVSETTVSHAGGSTLPPNKEVQPRPCSEMGEETATLF